MKKKRHPIYKIVFIFVFAIGCGIFAMSDDINFNKISVEEIYEDSESGSVEKWVFYDRWYFGGNLKNVYDSELKSRVIKMDNRKHLGGFVLKGNNGNDWKDTDHKVIQWDVKQNRLSTFYVTIETKYGLRYLVYYYDNEEKKTSDYRYIYFNLNSNGVINNWINITRNLNDDIKFFEKNNEVISIKSFSVDGDLYIDNVKTCNDKKSLSVNIFEKIDEDIYEKKLENKTKEQFILEELKDLVYEENNKNIQNINKEVKVNSGINLDFKNNEYNNDRIKVVDGIRHCIFKHNIFFKDKHPDKDIEYPYLLTTKKVEDIEKAFNKARYLDSTVFNKRLKMPLQRIWDRMTVQEKGLYIVNAEREARGILPFEGINSKVIAVAQKYAEDLIKNNYFEHDRKSDGADPWERLEEDKDILINQDWYEYGENLYAASYIGDENQVVDAIYNWIYNDSISSWGHRDFILSKLTNNSGDSKSEGLIGFGIEYGNYNIFDTGKGIVIVMNGFDPSETWNSGVLNKIDTELANICGY